ncbi:hypothetical protein JCM1841_004521 [Sporobolomyces salmonicolor]
MDDSDPEFASPSAALAHYRQLCTSLQSQLAAAEQDIQDFTESSKELQNELEQELERMEKAEKGMRRELEECQGDREGWKSKYTTALRDHTTTITHMQRELESLRASEKTLRTQLRDMELDNDDLEKSEREKDSSLQDLETRYNKSLERIALLEEELVTKAQLEEEVQRLKDELRDVNEELLVVRSSTLPAPGGPSRPLTPPGTASLPPVAPTEPSSSANNLDSHSTPRRTPSPSYASPPPSIELVNPTPMHTSTLSISPSVRAGLARTTSTSSGSPGFPRSTTLARSTRMSQLGGMVPPSPSTTSLPRPRSPTKAMATVGQPRRADGMIRDMQLMTSRVKQLTQRLDSRRNLVMAGSGIPRASMSPTSSMHTGLSRSTTRTGLARSVARPSSRLGHQASDSSGSSTITSTRPPSRSAMRNSIQGPRTSIPTAVPPLPGNHMGRPPSRMSSLSASSTTGSSRPVTPTNLPSRSPTPTAGLRASSRPAWNAGSGTALGKSTNGAADRRRTSSTYGASTASSLSKTVGPAGSGRASADLSATIRRPPSSASDASSSSALGVSTTGTTKVRRASAGLGLGVTGLARSVMGRRASQSGTGPGGSNGA